MPTKTFNIYKQKNQAVQDAYAMLSANILLSGNKKAIKTLVLTSCRPKVGKTAIAIGLAMTMAGSGWKILLVDADMRKPMEAKHLDSGSVFGLSDFLSGEAELLDTLCKTSVKNLTFLSCGKDVINPIGLLCSIRFEEFMEKVRHEYDFVIFDTPSLASVVDASLVSAKADASLLLVEIDRTTLIMLKRAKEQLEKVNANILGVVMNKVKKRDYKRYFNAYDYFKNTKRFFKNKKRKKDKFVVTI